MEQSRLEFVLLAGHEDANVRELCRRFDVAPSGAYKWLNRFREQGVEGLSARSRRPHTSPSRCPVETEDAVLLVRTKNPAWGGRKIRRVLLNQSLAYVPSASTITEVLRRHGTLDGPESASQGPWQRFEREEPNLLWQMDFKGHFDTARGRCHPLTVLDDHSRYLVHLSACADERTGTVKERLADTFRRYGLPQTILTDNGPPWGSTAEHDLTPLGVWLMRLDVRVVHSRPYHPQTGGKHERLHRTLKAEVLAGRRFANLRECQAAFDAWRPAYNMERPHEALEMATPASRYKASPWTFPEKLPEVEYGAEEVVRKVQQGGIVHFRGKELRVPQALTGQPVGLRPTGWDGVFELRYCRQPIGRYDLRSTAQTPIESVHNVSEHL